MRGKGAGRRAERFPSARALVVSTENITQNWYFGNERSMLIPNCLFRVGGAACLLSNRRRDSWRAKCAPRPAPPGRKSSRSRGCSAQRRGSRRAESACRPAPPSRSCLHRQGRHAQRMGAGACALSLMPLACLHAHAWSAAPVPPACHGLAPSHTNAVPRAVHAAAGAEHSRARRARRYELSHVVRTHMGAQEASYSCVYQREDADGQARRHEHPGPVLR